MKGTNRLSSWSSSSWYH